MTPSEGDIPVRVPRLDLEGCVLGTWLVRRGQRVLAGDRLLEIWAGDVLADISAPATGVLVTKELDEDQPVEEGQIVGWIRPMPLS